MKFSKIFFNTYSTALDKKTFSPKEKTNTRDGPFQKFSNQKKQTFPFQILEKYYLKDEIDKEIFNTNSTQVSDEIDMDHPVLLSKIILNLIKKPQQSKKILEKISDNPTLLFDILICSSLYKELFEKKVTFPSPYLILDNIITLTKYIRIIYYTNSILITNNKIEKAVSECILNFNKHLNINVTTEDQVCYRIDFMFELTQIRDRLVNTGNNYKTNILEDYLNSQVINQNVLRDLLTHLFSSEKTKLSNPNLHMEYFFKFIYVLAKISSFNKKFSFNKILEKFFSHTFKTKMLSFLENLNIEDYDFFKYEKEKIIIFYLCLQKLNFLDKKMITSIKYNFFDYESFHIFFKSLLQQPDFIRHLDYESLRSMLNNSYNINVFYANFNIKKAMLMNKSLNWVINTNLAYVNFHNSNGKIQINDTNYLNVLLNKLINLLPKTTDPNEIIFISWMLSSYLANPESYFEIIEEKSFDIEELNPTLLSNFIDSVSLRLKYFIRYDHEAALLRNLRKDYFLPYENHMDKMIIYITKQFLYKIETNNKLPPELFLVGLKCLKILFNNETSHSSYRIDESIIQSIRLLVGKCLVRGSVYSKYINKANTQILLILTEILPHIKYYYDLTNLSKAKNPLFINLFEDFLLNAAKIEFSELEDKLNMINYILEYIIFQSWNKNENEELPATLNDIINYINNYLENILINQSNTKLLDFTLLNNSSFPQSNIPIFLVNIYYVMSLNTSRYLHLFDQLEDYIKNMNGLRNLTGYDILKLKKELINVNTMTQIFSNMQTIAITSNDKKNILSKILSKENLKNFITTILNTYENHFNTDDSMNSIINISSFSYFTSNIFEIFNTVEITKILKILGNNKIENYHPFFISKLNSKFSNRELLFSLLKTKEVEFFELALAWPLFVKNEELIRTIIHCHLSKLMQIKRYGVTNLLSSNHVNHTNLLTFFGKLIKNKIKNIATKKQILCDYLANCVYVGYKMEVSIYEEILTVYEEINNHYKKQAFEITDLVNLIVVSINGSILDTSLSKENQKIYYEILPEISKNVGNTLILKTENKVVNYYPSIVSQERYFQKSLTNYFQNYEEPVEIEQDNESSNELKLNMKDYTRKIGEGKDSVDLLFEQYFSKKKKLMYGDQIDLKDDKVSRQIAYIWYILKYFGIQFEKEHLETQLNQFFTKIRNSNYDNKPLYLRFSLKMTNFSINNNFKIVDNYDSLEHGFRVDYILSKSNKTFFVLIVPREFTSHNIEEDKQHPDGLYTLIINCIKRLNNQHLIVIFESELGNLLSNEIEFQVSIANKLNC